MIFKLYYFFSAAGMNAASILIGIFLGAYTDASPAEIGTLLMLLPMSGLISKPIICSMADRNQAHRRYLMWCQFIGALSYSPFIIVPLLGPDLYQRHSRLCWYFLVVVKVSGNTAFHGCGSLGDALAINYSKRLGTNFSVYRIWGTISWMLFGFITGQINETPLLPKYVPAFIVLVVTQLCNLVCVYLWPPEYFTIVPMDKIKHDSTVLETQCLLPRHVVWAHAKRQLCKLVPFCGASNKYVADDVQLHSEQSPRQYDIEQNNKPDPELSAAAKTVSLADLSVLTLPELNFKNDSTSSTDSAGKHADHTDNTASPYTEMELTKTMQVKTLFLLMRRDLRMVPHLICFIFCGFMYSPVTFFFMSLPARCNEATNCNFSELAGLLQLAMASIETVYFMYYSKLVKKLGRLNLLSAATLFCTIKFGFYSTIWRDVNPYWSVLSEVLTGLIYSIPLTVAMDVGYIFSNQVMHIIPELEQRRIIPSSTGLSLQQIESNHSKIKSCLVATMQAIISALSDGLGNGGGSFICGLVANHFSYIVLWQVVALVSFVVCATLVTINILDNLCKFKLGLRDKAQQLSID